MGLTKKRFLEIAQEFNLLASPHQLEGMYLKVMMEVEGGEGAVAVGKFVATYIAAFRQRYGVAPALSGPDKGAAKNIVKAQGLDAACKIVGAYLRSDDGYFRQRMHDLVTLQSNLNRVHVQHETGRTVTQTEVRQDDRGQANKNIALDYLREAGESDGDEP